MIFFKMKKIAIHHIRTAYSLYIWIPTCCYYNSLPAHSHWMWTHRLPSCWNHKWTPWPTGKQCLACNERATMCIQMTCCDPSTVKTQFTSCMLYFMQFEFFCSSSHQVSNLPLDKTRCYLNTIWIALAYERWISNEFGAAVIKLGLT